jgi:hypothetical protein
MIIAGILDQSAGAALEEDDLENEISTLMRL